MSRTLPTRLTLPVMFSVALATGFSGAVVPGSLLAVVVRESVRAGWLAGPTMMLGHGALELIAVIMLSTGLIQFVRSPHVRGLIGVIGGAVLLYLGYLTLGTSGEAGAAALRVESAVPPGSTLTVGELTRFAFLGGLMSMINPYWWLWWATIGVAHIGWATQRGRLGGGTYFAGHLLSDVIWYCAVAAAVGAGRTLFSPSVLRAIYIGCGGFLIALGLIFGAAGGKALLNRRAL